MTPETLTTSQIAAICGVSPRRIQQLAKAGVIGKSAPGRFTLDSLTQYIRYLHKRQITAAGKVGNSIGKEGDYNAAKLRLTLAQAKLAEIAATKAIAEVVGVEHVERALSVLCSEIRASIHSIPARVASQVIGLTDERSIKGIMLSEIDAVLTALADAPTIIPAAPDDDEAAGL